MLNTEAPVVAGNVMPGVDKTKWQLIAATSGNITIPFEDWQRLSLQSKITTENAAVRNYLHNKNPEYHKELTRIAVNCMKPMNDAQRVEIVIPSYNEQDNIARTINQIIAAAENSGKYGDPSLWGITVVVNRPLTGNATREESEKSNLESTVKVLQQLQTKYPNINLHYVVVEAEKNIAGVGLARMIGHDLSSLRSMLRDESKRLYPCYLQTLDADVLQLNNTFFREILSAIETDKYEKDFYRQRDTFPVESMRQFPLLNAIDFCWNDTFSGLSWATDQAWTVGRGTLISVNAHVSAGGSFPFKFKGGVDEDIRIGTHARLLRGRGKTEGQGEIQSPLVTSDPVRALMAVCEVNDAIHNGLGTSSKILTRDLHEACRTLKYYRVFHEVDATSTSRHSHPDAKWLETADAFNMAVPMIGLEVIANSYRELAREGITQQIIRESDLDPAAETIFRHFARGHVPYSSMCDIFTRWSLTIGQFPDNRNGKESSRAKIRELIDIGNKKATDLMVKILRQRGIDCYIDHNEDLTPPAKGDLNARVPWPIKVTDTSEYRQRLIKLLSN